MVILFRMLSIVLIFFCKFFEAGCFCANAASIYRVAFKTRKLLNKINPIASHSKNSCGKTVGFIYIWADNSNAYNITQRSVANMRVVYMLASQISSRGSHAAINYKNRFYYLVFVAAKRIADADAPSFAFAVFPTCFNIAAGIHIKIFISEF